MTASTPSAAPAGGRRFWLTVAAFALANAAAWLGYHHYARTHQPRLLRVERFSHADGGAVAPRPTFTWSFNLDVAPPATGTPGTITPAVPGTWNWPDPRTLTFTPDADLPKATQFTLSLSHERVRTADGFQADQPFSQTVRTEGLTLRDVRQVGFESRDDRLVLELEFDDPVVPADVLRHLTLEGPDGKPLSCELHGEAEGAVVRVRTAPLPPAPLSGRPEQPVRVMLAAGLAGRSGPLGMSEPVERLVTIAADLMATGAEASAGGRGEAEIRLRFNNDVEPARIREVLSLDPPAAFTVASTYGHGVELHGDFAPGTRYALQLAAPPAGSDKARYPRPTTLSVFVPDHEASVWFEHESGYLGSRGNRTLLAHATNAFDLTVRVTRVYDENLVGWRNAAKRKRWFSEHDAYAAPLVERQIKLPRVKNEKQAVRLSLDELLPPGAARDGAYRVSLSHDVYEGDDGTGRGYRYVRDDAAVVTLSDIGLSAKRGRDSVMAWAVSLATAEPLAGVRVRAFSNKNVALGEAVTDENGLARIDGIAPAAGEEPAVLIADGPATSGGAGEGLTWLDLRDSGVTFAEADTGGRAYLRDGYEAFVYTDRGVYRPGETVHLRAIVRGGGEDDDATPGPFPVQVRLLRPDLRDWRSEMVTLDTDGAAGLTLALPSDLPTGKWTARVGLPGETSGADAKPFGSVTFQVEEFIPDRMKVELTVGEGVKGDDGAAADAARLSLDDDGNVRAELQGDYLFGRPVAKRPGSLVARADPAKFAPANWKGWTFGDAAGSAGPLGAEQPLGRRAELPVVELDDAGHAGWEVNVTELLEKGEAVGAAKGKPSADAPEGGVAERYAGPWTLTMTGSVTEEGGRAVSATRRVEIDRAPYYLGVRRPGRLVEPGAETSFDIALVAPGGDVAPVDDVNVTATLYREQWNNSFVHENGRYRYETTRLLEAVEDGAGGVAISQGRGTCAVTCPGGGSYVLRLRDAKTGVVTSASFYAGRDTWDDDVSREHPERLEVILLPGGGSRDAIVDALRKRDFAGAAAAARRALEPAPEKPADRRFRVGEPARVLVRSPFKGRLLLTVETDEVVSARVVDMKASQVTLPIDVTAACRPNAYVTATVVRPIDPDAAWRVHRAVGTSRLRVDNADRRLAVEIAAPPEVRPSTTLSAQVLVTDADGNPAADAAVTVAAVDEGICRLTDFKTPDPLGFFTGLRALAVATADLYGQLMPEVPRPDKTSSPGGDNGDGADDGRYRSPVAAKRVKPVALFSGVVRTDAAGVARVEFQVPQFAGQLRLMAVAYRGGGGGATPAPIGYGSAERAVSVRSPLLVQSSWPRFAAPGDRFTVPLVVFNNSAEAGSVDIKLDLAPGAGGKPAPLAFAEPGVDQPAASVARTVQLAAGGQAVTSVDASALDRVGVAHVRLVASLGGERFEETLELPVRPASPEITTGGYATASPDKPAKIDIPGGMLGGTERVQVTVTPWPTLQLPDGLDYLERYPYGCAEQTISGLFPLVYLSDIGTQIAPHVFDRQRVADKVQAGVVRLLGLRAADGGLGMWPGSRQPSWPWASVYAAHFVVEARAAEHEIPDDLYDGLLAYARSLLNAGGDEPDRLEAQAYACYVLALAGRPDRAAMSRVGELLVTGGDADGQAAATGNTSAAHARFHLAAAWLAAGRRDLAEKLIPRTLPPPRAGRQLAGNVGSPVRDRALLLSTLLAVEPDHPDLPALARSLADAGRAGRWQSTQDTAFAVMALGRYVKHAAKAEPYTGVELLQAGQVTRSAKAGESIAWDGPDAASGAVAPSEFEVRVAAPAGAKAHVAWLQTGVPLQPPADADHGMTVRRRYLDDRGAPLASNALRSGDLVKVELTIESATPLENVVIEDLLPAGLEIENPRLVTATPEDQDDEDDATPRFDDRRLDIRDDRLILAGDLTAAGAATYVYTARAVAPGVFVVPPVRAECMYDMGTSSVSDGGGMLHVTPAGAANIVDVGRD